MFYDRQSPEDGPRRGGAPDDDDQRSAEHQPALDLVESPASYEVVIDLPGVPASAVSVVFRGGLLIVSGVKIATACHARHAAFHLAERSFGHFVRVVRFAGACDFSRATASLVNGELRILVPRIEERRGQPRTVPVAGA
jgi:HSP20 family molecular chaperone IbpA